MSCDVSISKMGEGQCVYPNDCGGCGCSTGCGGFDDLPLARTPLGHVRYYSNELLSTCCSPWNEDETPLPTQFDFGMGFGWLASDWPYLADADNGAAKRPVVAVLPPMKPLWFCACGDADTYTAQGHDFKLEYSASGFLLKGPDGSKWQFESFATGKAKGRFVSYQPPGGNVTHIGNGSAGYAPNYSDCFTSFGHIKEIYTKYTDENGITHTESYLYSYTTTATNERLASVTLRRRQGTEGSFQEIAQVQYEYASGDSDNLQRVQYRENGSGPWKVTGYYRYYGENETGGPLDALKYALGVEEYRDLSAVANPLTADNSVVAQYAAQAFTYDEDTGRVATRTTGGGKVTYSYTYLDYTGTETGNNQWARKTTTAGSDGIVTIEYVNTLGQTLIRETTADSDVSREYFEYDDQGNLTRQANSAAIESLAHATDGDDNPTVTLSATNGMIRLSTYYTETTTGSGGVGVEGYKQFDKIQHGTAGSEILLKKYEYSQRQVTSGEDTTTIYPLLRETVYPTETSTDTNGVATEYQNTSWHTDTLQVEERTTVLPAVPAAQNGSGTAATRTERFDLRGNLVWSRDERGTISYNKYDTLTGNLLQSIADVNGSLLTLPTGWSTPAGDGLHLVTDYSYDSLGRLVETLGPEHNAVVPSAEVTEAKAIRTANWTVYIPAADDASGDEVWSAQGFLNVSTSQYTLVNPVSITIQDAAGRTIESIQAVRTSTAGRLLSTDSFPQSSYVGWNTTQYRGDGLVASTRAYHTIPAEGSGTSSANYNETSYGYDTLGRQNMQKTPGGTITRSVYDAQGRTVAVYVGTDDTNATDADPTGGNGSGGANNMVFVRETLYAPSGGCSSCGGGGGGNVIAEISHVDATTARTTEYLYDWRDRREYTLAPFDTATLATYSRNYFDNLGRVVKAERYHDVAQDGPDTHGGGSLDDDILIARSETLYDTRGQVYQTKTYAVDPTTGTVGNALTSNTWYDDAGRTIKQQPAGSNSFTKTVYDSLGRAVKQYIGFGTETSYADACTLDNDMIFEQSETFYDPAGNTTFAISRSRLHDAIYKGELVTPDAAPGALCESPMGIPSHHHRHRKSARRRNAGRIGRWPGLDRMLGDLPQPHARAIHIAFWYDGVGRQIASANYGTNDGLPMTAADRPQTIPARTSATGSASAVLVTSTEYDLIGKPYKTIDPADRVDLQEYDAAGRLVKTIQNYVEGGTATDQNVTVETAYTADGQTATLTVVNAITTNQVTRYVYGTTLTDSHIARADLLRGVIYPDSDDTCGVDMPPIFGGGTDGVYDRVEYKYNRVGELIELKDQNETVHAYSYDALGRQTSDRVTALGDSIDNAVLRIQRSYEVRGMMKHVTSYDAATGGNVQSDVQLAYNAFGQLAADYQSHSGAVDTGSTLKVQYAYTDGSLNHARLMGVIYPNGRVLHYGYCPSSLAAGQSNSSPLPLGEGQGVRAPGDAFNRVSFLSETDADGQRLAEYTYLGRSQVVKVDYSQPSVANDFTTRDRRENYTSFDRFGRVVDHRWTRGATKTDVVRIRHGYDTAGNRLWRKNDVSPLQTTPVYTDELYAYDGMNQLIAFDRGQLYAVQTHAIAPNRTPDEQRAVDRLCLCSEGPCTCGSVCRSGTPVPDTMFPAPGAISDAERLDGVRMSMISARKTFAEHWALDPTGNWTGYKQDTDGDGVWDLDQTRTHNAANEITGHAELADPVENAWATPAYDRAGNMVSVPKSDLPTSSYQCIYDAWNRLVRVRDGKKTVAEYQYDGRNFRVVKKTYTTGVFSEVRHFYYTNDWQVLEERASDTLTSDPRTLAPVSQFVWGQRYIDDLILRDRDTNADGILDERLYALQDANWNVVALADTTGEIVERYSYSAYGTPVFLDSSHVARVSSLYNWNILYCGYRWDNLSQKYQVRYRNLWSHLGRWERRDPIGYQGGINLYCYVRNRTLINTDPRGLRTAKPFEYVPGAVEFRSGQKPYWMHKNQEISGELSSSFQIQARPLTNMFPPCTCTLIGYVQIERAALDAFGWLGGFKSIANTRDWQVDVTIPYPHSGTTDPRKMWWIDFNDYPGGINSTGLGWTIRTVVQDFEVHVMCLAGQERKAVYGGFSWGHSFNLDTSDDWYRYSSYSQRINTPTKVFQDLVNRWYRQHTDLGPLSK